MSRCKFVVVLGLFIIGGGCAGEIGAAGEGGRSGSEEDPLAPGGGEPGGAGPGAPGGSGAPGTPGTPGTPATPPAPGSTSPIFRFDLSLERPVGGVRMLTRSELVRAVATLTG